MDKKSRENKKLFAIENADKTDMAEVAKASSAINLGNKDSWTISNADMDAASDLRQISIIKYWKCASQIQDKIDWLHKDWIFAFRVFVKYSLKTRDNKKITKNMIIRYEIASK